jgi:hypothetical protein
VADVWLRKGYVFIGRVTIGSGWEQAPIYLKPNLDLHIFLPGLYSTGNDKNIPKSIEGRIENWNIQINDGAVSTSFRPGNLYSLIEPVIQQLDEEDKKLFPEDAGNKIWTEVFFSPKSVMFEKIDSPTNIPDEWGLTFYPPKNNNILFHFFSGNRNPRRLPNIFTVVDSSVYFSNVEQWNFDAFRKRLRVLTSALSFFTGAPVTYELLVGRFKRDVLYMQIKNIPNPNAYTCPSQYNGRVEIKENYLSSFPSKFIRSIEELFKKNKDEKVAILLSYFKMLYMAFYDEAKIAFSFQLMESLSKYKGIKFGETYKNKIIKRLSKKISKKMCAGCNRLLQEEVKTEKDDFNEYIDKAMNVIKGDDQFMVDPAIIKKIARKYRNEIFHGSFFENMTSMKDIAKTLPEGYQRDLPVVFQILALIIGAHFVLDLDFDHMIALKSRNDFSVFFR